MRRVTPITLATNTPGTPIGVGAAPKGIAILPSGTFPAADLSLTQSAVPTSLLAGATVTHTLTDRHQPRTDRDWVEVYLLADGSYATPQILEAGSVLRTALLPGMEIDVRDLLRQEF